MRGIDAEHIGFARTPQRYFDVADPVCGGDKTGHWSAGIVLSAADLYQPAKPMTHASFPNRLRFDSVCRALSRWSEHHGPTDPDHSARFHRG